MAAIKHGCNNVLIGTVVTDQRHMDGSPEFIRSLNETLVLQEGRIRLEAPAVSMTSVELVVIRKFQMVF